MTKCGPKLRTSASSQQMRSPSAASSDFHSALPFPEPGRQLGQHVLDGEDTGARPAGDLRGGVGRSVVEDDDLVDEAGPLDEIAANRRARCGRPSPPRRGPGGTPRRSARAGPSPRRGRRGRDVVAGRRAGSSGHVSREPTGRRAPVLRSSPARAHRERPRDRPCDAAATSFRPGNRSPETASQVPMPDR